MNDDREVLIDFNIVTVIFTSVHTLKINVEEKRGKKYMTNTNLNVRKTM